MAQSIVYSRLRHRLPVCVLASMLLSINVSSAAPFIPAACDRFKGEWVLEEGQLFGGGSEPPSSIVITSKKVLFGAEPYVNAVKCTHENAGWSMAFAKGVNGPLMIEDHGKKMPDGRTLRQDPSEDTLYAVVLGFPGVKYRRR